MTHLSERRRRQRGSILLLSILILTLIFVFVSDAMSVSLIEYESSRNSADMLKLEAALRYGYELGKAHLRQDLDDTEIDSLAEEWCAAIEAEVKAPNRDGSQTTASVDVPPKDGTQPAGLKVTVEIEDEERKFPLGILVGQNDNMLRRNREALAGVIDAFRENTAEDVDLGTADRMAELITAFIARREGEASGPVPRPNTKSDIHLFNVADLALIKEINDAVMFDQVDRDGTVIPGLTRFLTIHSDLQININTAPLAVLRGLFRPDDRIIADNIYDYRLQKDREMARDEDSRNRPRGGDGRDGPQGADAEPDVAGAVFEKVDDAQQKVTGFSRRAFDEARNKMTTTSRVFSIWATASLGGVSRTRHWIVRREANGFRQILSEQIDLNYRPRFRIPEEDGSEGVERRKLKKQEREEERRAGRKRP